MNKALFETLTYEDDMVDVAVQCEMMGEGYDNTMLSVLAIIAPPGAVSKVAQLIGRVVRKPKMRGNPMSQLMVAHVFYPKWPQICAVMKQYRLAEDERVEHLFAVGLVLVFSFKIWC